MVDAKFNLIKNRNKELKNLENLFSHPLKNETNYIFSCQPTSGIWHILDTLENTETLENPPFSYRMTRISFGKGKSLKHILQKFKIILVPNKMLREKSWLADRCSSFEVAYSAPCMYGNRGGTTMGYQEGY